MYLCEPREVAHPCAMEDPVPPPWAADNPHSIRRFTSPHNFIVTGPGLLGARHDAPILTSREYLGRFTTLHLRTGREHLRHAATFGLSRRDGGIQRDTRPSPSGRGGNIIRAAREAAR